MQSRSYLFLLIVLVLGVLSGWLYTIRPFHYGLDVSGGVRFTFQIDPTTLTAQQKENMDDVRTNVRRVLVERAGGPLAVAEPVVIQKGDDQFVVELPGFTNVDQAKDALQTSASIKFYDASTVKSEDATYRPYGKQEETDKQGNPYVAFTDLSGRTIQPNTPEYLQIIKAWGDPIVQGDDLSHAQPQPFGEGMEIQMLFTDQGGSKLESWSRVHFGHREPIAAVLDGRVISLSELVKNAILGKTTVIEGKFTNEYANKVSNLLNAGALPVDLKVISTESVDPTIGKTALKQMVTAGVAAFGLISLFLIVYYAFPGIIAFVALVLYVLFTLTALKLFNATFSLAAIAGFILSVGMAVDANILVFERFKEEMKKGKNLKTAIDLGFRRALPAIIDSNACTIITSAVLVNFGTGPVKGFATTLIIGVAISLFTAVAITRSLLMFFVGSGMVSNPNWYAVNRQWFGEKYEETAHHEPLLVVQKSKKWFLISIATVVIGFLFIPIGGLRLNVEFRGGYEAKFMLPAGITSQDLGSKLEAAGLKGANVTISSSGNQKTAAISVPFLPQLNGNRDHDIPVIASATGLNAADQRGYTNIGPTIQKETIQNAILGIIVSSALIILYLAVRFGLALGGIIPGLRFGISAILAMMHDVLVLIGVAAIVGFLFHWEVSALFITAMLTMIGFSVHDTIVIFDRIRENLRRPLPGEDFAHLVNRSITQSFARSINTSATVVATLLILVIAGTATAELKFFTVAMLVGIVSGTYSSIYNASPILYLWDLAVGKKHGADHTLVGLANQQGIHPRLVAAPVADQEPAATAIGRSYGQVRRRAKPQEKGHIEIED